MRPAALAPTLPGRGHERARLLDAVRAGLDQSPRAVLVHGEAGVGKTSLVRSVCDEVRCEGARVLWGQSLRFGTVEAMYHPLVLALEAWLDEADASARASVLEAVPGATLILPSLGASPAEGPSALMMVVDALLARVVARGPTVLVVDDVQWADPATLDALSYLVAGFGRQRLALVTTHRDEAAGSEGFQHWLGNLRRLPGTEELALTGSTRKPPATRSPYCWVRHRRPGWWGRYSRGLWATRTSASCWCVGATLIQPSSPRICPTSSARHCLTPGGRCQGSAGDHADPGDRGSPDRPAHADGNRRGARHLRGRGGPRGRRRRCRRARS